MFDFPCIPSHSAHCIGYLDLGMTPALAKMNALGLLELRTTSSENFSKIPSRKAPSCVLTFPGLDVGILNECSQSSGIPFHLGG